MTTPKGNVLFVSRFRFMAVVFKWKKANKNLLVQLTKSISKAESSNLSFERYSRDTKERLRGNLHLGCCLLQFNVRHFFCCITIKCLKHVNTIFLKIFSLNISFNREESRISLAPWPVHLEDLNRRLLIQEWILSWFPPWWVYCQDHRDQGAAEVLTWPLFCPLFKVSLKEEVPVASWIS